MSNKRRPASDRSLHHYRIPQTLVGWNQQQKGPSLKQSAKNGCQRCTWFKTTVLTHSQERNADQQNTVVPLSECFLNNFYVLYIDFHVLSFFTVHTCCFMQNKSMMMMMMMNMAVMLTGLRHLSVLHLVSAGNLSGLQKAVQAFHLFQSRRRSNRSLRTNHHDICIRAFIYAIYSHHFQ